MAKTRQQKIETVKNLSEKFSRAKSVVFTDYKGLTMKQLSDLRSKLAEVQSEFTITKNTLLNKANPEINLQGPTATLFGFDDEISPIKLLVKALKDQDKNVQLYVYSGADHNLAGGDNSWNLAVERSILWFNTHL